MKANPAIHAASVDLVVRRGASDAKRRQPDDWKFGDLSALLEHDQQRLPEPHWDAHTAHAGRRRSTGMNE